MAELQMMFMGSILMSTIGLTVLLFRNGQYAQKEWVFMLIQMYVVLLAGMQITAVPENDLLGQGVGYGIFILALAPLFYKKNNFFAARMTLVVLLMIAPLVLFFL